MKIAIKLFATLQQHLPDNRQGTHVLNIPEGSTVAQVLDQLKIPHDIPKIILINGIQKKTDKVLQEGDSLSIFPPIAGG